MTVVGLALVICGVALDLPASWTLVGLLLAWAGIVKVVVVVLWRGIAAAQIPERSPQNER
jgi:hypothetical protein